MSLSCDTHCVLWMQTALPATSHTPGDSCTMHRHWRTFMLPGSPTPQPWLSNAYYCLHLPSWDSSPHDCECPVARAASNKNPRTWWHQLQKWGKIKISHARLRSFSWLGIRAVKQSHTANKNSLVLLRLLTVVTQHLVIIRVITQVITQVITCTMNSMGHIINKWHRMCTIVCIQSVTSRG